MTMRPLEAMFTYNTRDLANLDRFAEALGSMSERRLTYTHTQERHEVATHEPTCPPIRMPTR